MISFYKDAFPFEQIEILVLERKTSSLGAVFKLSFSIFFSIANNSWLASAAFALRKTSMIK
jgi:hypothetical protein